jgi:exonuclease SbcC
MHDETESRLKSLEAEQAAATSERDRTQREVEAAGELQRKIESLRRSIEQLRVKLEFKRDSLAGARESAEHARAAAAAVEAARKGYEQYLAASARLTKLEKRREERDLARNRTARIEHELIEARSQSKLHQGRLNEIAGARGELARLADRIEEQRNIESKLARLREGRGELISLRSRIAAIDLELETLRSRYSELSRQVESAEARREEAGMAESLEAERARLDAEINQSELALNNYKLKRDHLKTMMQEERRLAGELEQYTRQIDELEPMLDQAGRLAEFESLHQSHSESLARLRAEVSRDEEMIRALDQGGICPLLTEKCLNLKPGESVDSRFRSGLDSRRAEIERLQGKLASISEEAKQSREAAAQTSRLPYLRSESTRASDYIDSHRKRMAGVEAEISASAKISDDEVRKLKTLRADIDSRLKRSREAERIYNQAEFLRQELAQISKDGETRKKEREEISLRIDNLGDIESQLADSESALAALGDPRGRAAALNRIIEREDELRQELAASESLVAQIEKNLEQAGVELQVFAELDGEIAATQRERAATERDYHLFIANEKIAVTVASREREMAEINSEIDHTDQALNDAVEALADDEKLYDADRHARSIAELDKLRERSTQLSAQIEHTREQFSRLQAQFAHLNQVRDRLREQIAERDRSSRLRETADFIRDILLKAAPYITESYLFSISIEANQLFREITGRHDVTLRWMKDYEITIEEEGRERPFLNLSGGEQMAAALAVRLALLKELSEFNIAFFDEPTTNMDEERRRNLAQQIGRIRDFQQLFVISHDDSFEGYTDQIVSLG